VIFEGNEGDAGTDIEFLCEFPPTVVAAEKDDSVGSLSKISEFWFVVFKGPNCEAYSRRSESPIEVPIKPFGFVGG